jgi:hypothetical protein
MKFLLLLEDPLNFFLILDLFVIIYYHKKDKHKVLKWITFSILFLILILCLVFNPLFIDLWVLLILSSSLIIYKKLIEYFEFQKMKVREYTHYNNVEIEGFEKYIYDRDFKKFMTNKQFLELFNSTDCKILKKTSELAREGSCFDKVFYFAKIPGKKSVVLRNNDITISYLEEGSWIGLIELILYYTDNSLDKWLIDLHFHYDNEDVIIYQWDVMSLINLVNYSKDIELVNSILKVWINYLVYCMKRLDNHIANALRAIINNDKKAKIHAIPICKHSLII